MANSKLTPLRARTLIEKFRSSHSTQAQFCKAHAVSMSLFTYWQPLLESHPSPSFQEVPLALPHVHPPCTLTFPNGCRLEFPATLLPSTLRLLSEAKAPC